MEKLAHKSKNFILRTLLLIATLCLFLVVLFEAVLLVAINALNTGKAHEYIQAQVTSALAVSGYNATFDKLIYDPVRGFTLYNLTVVDKDGTIATADKFSLDIDFSKIPLKQLDMTVSAGTINLVRLPETPPETKDEADSGALQPFATPDMYFTRLKVSHFNIGALNIGEQVAGTALTFSPNLKIDLKIGEQINLDALLLPKAGTKFGEVSLPDRVEIAGNFTPSTLSFSLENLLVASSDYNLKGKGNGTLLSDGIINIALDAAYPDLKKLTKENLESANLSLLINGSSAHPTLHINGTLVPASFKKKGLTDIQVTADADDIIEALKGNVNVKTSYLEKPISLDAALGYSASVLTVESLKGTAPLVDVSGSGTVSTADSIFDGKISISASDLSYYKDLLSQDIAGAVKVDVVLGSKNAAQSADINASAQQIKLDTIQLGNADVELHFADLKYLWPQTGNVKISNLSLSDGISLDRAEVNIKDIGNEAYSLSLIGNAHLPSAVGFKGNANLSNMTNVFPTVSDINFTTTLGSSSVTLAGAVDPNKVDLKINTKNFRGSDIPANVSDALSNIRLNGDITMAGETAAPVTQAHVSLNGLNTGAYKNLNITADVNHQGDNVTAVVLGKGAGIKTLKANAAFPLKFALFPFVFNLDMNSPLSGDIIGDLDLGTLSTLFLPPTQKFSANLKAKGTISGTLGVPDAKGKLSLRNGQFIDEQNGIELGALNINSSFTKTVLTLESMTATDGEKGMMKGSGHVAFSGDQSTDFSLTMKKFHLPKSNLADGMMDATFSLANVSDGYALKGKVDIARMNIIVPETFQSKIPELNIIDRSKSDENTGASKIMSLAIKVNAPNQVFVRGWGLDAEFGGELDVAGDVTEPLVNGSLASKRGRYEEFGKRFTLARANLRFQGEVPPSPYLDIEATTPANDVTASVILTGPVTMPAITFSSTPVLPQDEVLSRLLFGRDTAKITPFQAIQLAQTLRRFSGEGSDGGLNPLELLRSATGLDDISIDTDANGETNVGVGKYLTDKVYLEFEKGKAENSGGANIQIEVTPSINVQSEVGQDAQAGGGIFWKRDY